MLGFSRTDCSRARASASALLDGELSELDVGRLRAHLRECPACTAWADQVEETTRRLRQARQEMPSEAIALPRARPRWTAAAAVAAACAAVAVAGVVAASGPQSYVGSPQTSPLVQPMGATARAILEQSLHGVGETLAGMFVPAPPRGIVHPL